MPERHPVRRTPPWRLIVPVLVGLFVVALFPCMAQQPAGSSEAVPTPPETAAEPEGPERIPVPEIAMRARQASNRLRQIRERLEPDSTVLEAADDLHDAEEDVYDLRAETEDRDPDTLGLVYLEDLLRRWGRLRATLDIRQELVKKRSEELSAWKTELREIRGPWVVTREAETDEELPDVLRESIESVLTAIDETETALNERLNDVLELQAQGSKQIEAVSNDLSQIRGALDRSRGRLFARQSAPIWTALLGVDDEKPFTNQVRSVWEKNTSELGDFSEDYQRRLDLHVAIFLVFLIVAIVLRRSAKLSTSDKDPDVRAAAHVLSRPLSSSLLIALILVAWFYPEAPGAVYQLALTLLLVPLLRLLPRLIPQSMRAPFYALSALYVVLRLADMSLHEPVFRKILTLVVSVVAGVGLFWLVRPGGRATLIGEERSWRVVVGLTRVAVALLGGAAVANVLGRDLLADLLLSATMRSLYLGLVLFVGYQVLAGSVMAFLRTRLAQASAAIRNHGALVKTRFMTIFRVAGVLTWVWFAFNLFHVWEPALEFTSAVLNNEWTVGTLRISLGDILVFALAIWASVKVSQFTRFVLEKDIFPHVELPRGVAPTILMLVHYAILAIGFLIAIAAAGLELDRFALIVGALGVGIGFGMQNLVNNFVSGLILIFERPIKIGDTIEVGQLIGEVRRIGIRSSTVRTYDGAEVIVPNGNLISSEVVNWTLSDRLRRIEVAVGVKYGNDPNAIRELLLEVARDNEEILDYPAPQALFQSFGDSSLDFVLRAWTRNFDNWYAIRSELTVGVNDALKRAGVEIPFPQRDLHVRSVDEGAAKSVRSDHRDDAV